MSEVKRNTKQQSSSSSSNDTITNISPSRSWSTTGTSSNERLLKSNTMSDSNIRRSSRRRETKPESFHVGDIVQITRDRVRCKGRLVSKRTTDSSSTNPRWLVAFDENSWEEQDMYESSFGMVISKSSGKGHASARRNGNNGKSKKAAAPGVTASTGIDSAHMDANNSKVSNKKTTELMQVDTPTVPTVSPCSSLGEGSSASKKRKADDSEDPSDGSTKATGKLSSDREVRRKRRQALVEEEEVKIAVAKAESPPAQKLKMDEDVIRVPMLTGTLFLYRGSHRRAEFIYKK